MKILSYKELDVDGDDDIIYSKILILLEQIKLAQGGKFLESTLRRHRRLSNYLLAKQAEKLSHLENTFFNEDGSLKTEVLTNISR